MSKLIIKTRDNLSQSIGSGSDRLLAIENKIAAHPILRHPFLELLKSGSLTKSQITAWISQQYYFSRQFPRCLAAIYAKLEDIDVSMPLIRFLSVEHWGAETESAHWKQFVDALGYFGLRAEDLKQNTPYKETKEYLDFRLHICLNKSIEEGLGAIAFGHEYVNASIFESYLQGMEKLEGIGEDALRYFRSHTEDEPYDYEIFKQIILSSCHTRDSFDLIRQGACDVLEARYSFFDKILARLQ